MQVIFLKCLGALATLFVVAAQRQGSEHSVWAVTGARAELPCPIPKNLPPGDQPVIVLWYIGSNTAPIYSYDARSSEFTSGEQWSQEEVLGNRAYFIPKLDPPKLVLEPVHLSDEGIYHCRVEYPITASTINTVNLTLVVPSPRPSIVWNGQEVGSWVGPVGEGELVDLVCRVRGGRPPPNLTWWQQERRLQGQQEQRTPPHLLPHSGTSNDDWMVESRVVLVATRDLYNTPLSCHSHTQVPPSHLPQLPPATTTMYINITLPVLDVEIQGGDGPIAEGTKVRLKCQSRGSQPPATILWYTEGQPLTEATTHFDEEDDLTTSTISLSVNRKADGAIVTCTAVNPVLKSSMNVSISLNVYYPPIVSLQLGGPLQGKELKEGDDVFFECIVRANPVYQRVTWSHNGVRIHQNTSQGIVVSGLSLAVRSLKRDNSGAYSCHASNSAGTTGSQPLYISVRHTPVCAGGSRHRTQGAARGEPSKVTCQVESLPDEIISWRWSVLQDDGTELDFPELQVLTEGRSQVSSIMVTPNRPEDYGRLTCRARNVIGWQHKPCIIALVAAGPPDTPTNCTAIVENEDGEPIEYADEDQNLMISVTCTEGYNGGLPQRFLMETLLNNQPYTNLTSDFPEWSLSDIGSGNSVTLKISAYNVRGMSDVIRKEVHTPQAEPRTRAVSSQVSPLIGALAGVAGVLLIIVIMGVLLRRFSKKRIRKSHSHKLVSMSLSGNEDLDDPDVVSSIQRRPPSLDVLAHEMPRSISRTNNGHALNNGSEMATQGPTDSEISNTSDSESECNTVVDMRTSTSQISINSKDLHKKSQHLYIPLPNQTPVKESSSPMNKSKWELSSSKYDSLVPVQVLCSAVSPATPVINLSSTRCPKTTGSNSLLRSTSPILNKTTSSNHSTNNTLPNNMLHSSSNSINKGPPLTKSVSTVLLADNSISERVKRKNSDLEKFRHIVKSNNSLSKEAPLAQDEVTDAYKDGGRVRLKSNLSPHRETRI